MKDFSGLERSLGHSFSDRALLRRALTHPSFGPMNNQRLEFLGDAVLQLCVSDLLFHREPALSEGGMTRLRALLVCRKALSAMALSVCLGQYVLMSVECEKNGGRKKQSILSDAMEATLAAIYLDSGLLPAMAVIKALLEPYLRERMADTDSKSELQELLQADGKEAPSYTTLSQDGPAHQRSFTVAVYSRDKELARATGQSKKHAQQEAARIALHQVRGTGNTDET